MRAALLSVAKKCRRCSNTLRVEVFGFGELPSDISVRPAVIVTDPRVALASAAAC